MIYPEFNDHQRDVFCVFSGPGCQSLRNYLNQEAAANALTSERTMFNDNAVEEIDIDIDIDNDNDENDLDNDIDGSEVFMVGPSNSSNPNNANLVPPPPPSNNLPGLTTTVDGHTIIPSALEAGTQHPIQQLSITPIFYPNHHIQAVGRHQAQNQLNLLSLPPLQIPAAVPASGTGSPSAMSPTLDAPLSVDEGEEFNEFPDLDAEPEQNNDHATTS